MRKSLVAMTLAALGMGLAAPASATPLTVGYELVPAPAPAVLGDAAPPNTSSYHALLPLDINSFAPITGDASITYDVDGLGDPIEGGAVTVNSLNSLTDLGAPGFFGEFIGMSGVVISSLVAPVTTTQTGGVLTSAPGQIALSGTVYCSYGGGFLCETLGVPEETALGGTVDVSVGGEGDLTYLSTTQPLALTLGSFATSGVALLYGAAVPEPGTLLLFGAGILGLAALGRRPKA